MKNIPFKKSSVVVWFLFALAVTLLLRQILTSSTPGDTAILPHEVTRAAPAHEGGGNAQPAATVIVVGAASVAGSEKTSTALVSSSPITVPTMVLPTITAPDAEHVPMFPGAYDIKAKEVKTIALGTETTYWVEASGDDLMNFYDSFLTQHDWVLVQKIKQGDNMPTDGRKYSWTDSKGVLPYDLDLLITPTDFLYGPYKGKLYVLVYEARVPNVERLPLYPGAQDVTSSDDICGSFACRTITYTTEARPYEVETYYNAIMPQLNTGSLGGSITNGMRFFRATGLVEHVKLFDLTITASDLKNDKFKIVLKVKYS